MFKTRYRLIKEDDPKYGCAFYYVEKKGPFASTWTQVRMSSYLHEAQRCLDNLLKDKRIVRTVIKEYEVKDGKASEVSV